MTEEEAIRQRRNYVNAWNETMVNIWKDQIRALNVIDSGQLLNSVITIPVQADGRFVDISVGEMFAMHGLFANYGVGREKARGNSGDIGPTTKSGKPRKFRERKEWFDKKYYASVMNMKDFLLESMGNEFVGIVSDKLIEAVNRR